MMVDAKGEFEVVCWAYKSVALLVGMKDNYTTVVSWVDLLVADKVVVLAYMMDEELLVELLGN